MENRITSETPISSDFGVGVVLVDDVDGSSGVNDLADGIGESSVVDIDPSTFGTIDTRQQEDGPIDQLKPPSSYPWANENDNRLQVPALMMIVVVLWLLVAAIMSLVVYRLWMKKCKEEKTVWSYVKRFRDEDVRVHKSRLGGWNVMYRRRLANRVKTYWSGELPKESEASTIIFDKSSSLQENANSSTLFEIDQLKPFGYQYSDQQDEIPDLQKTMSYHSVASGKTATMSNRIDEIRDRRNRGNIISFIQTNLAMEDYLVQTSPTRGFSVVFCDQAASAQEEGSFSSPRSNNRSLFAAEEGSFSDGSESSTEEHAGLLSPPQTQFTMTVDPTAECFSDLDPEAMLFQV